MLQRFCLMISLLLLSAVTLAANDELNDPWENWNRKVFAFNDKVDKWALKPVAKAYRFVMPEVLDKGVTNVFHNIGELPTSINGILQGKPKTSGKALLRFLINSTLGVLGIFDIAKQMGLERQPEDFAQTLAVWGVPSGNYLVLPFLGPSTFRGVSGITVDAYINPQNYLKDDEARYALWGLRVVDIRADLIPLEDLITGDAYVFMRTAYWQHQQFLIHDGKQADSFDQHDFDDDDWLEE